MTKNGTFFLSVITPDQFIPSVWDPYVYRQNDSMDLLGDFVAVEPVRSHAMFAMNAPFEPIEYRDIPASEYLSFGLRRGNLCKQETSAVDEGQLLFGTMRAYLGNVLVTPEAEWIWQAPPLRFQVKSEFVMVRPSDELVYFWLAYFRSQVFLAHLPLGAGGTRPRLPASNLLRTPVSLPPLEFRQEIHHTLRTLAKQEWHTRLSVEKTLDDLSCRLREV